MTTTPTDAEAAHLAMFESTWFGQGSAFWRWVQTPEAAPYVAAFVERLRALPPVQQFNLVSEVEEPHSILNSTDFDQLADDIEARYGEPDLAG